MGESAASAAGEPSPPAPASRGCKVVVNADTGWAVGFVHDNVAAALRAHGYTFKFHNSGSFQMAEFMRDVREADVLLTTMNLHRAIMRLLKTPADRRKVLVVAHGYSEIIADPTYDYTPLMTYAVTSDVIAPRFPRPADVYVTPNGVDLAHFERVVRDGAVRRLGWCGAARVGVKRVDWSYRIANATQLPVTIASSLSREHLKRWFHTVDILLVTSGPAAHEETGPLPAFEAIASGCVVVGTPVGNFRHVPGPKFTTVAEAAAAIHALKADADAMRRLAREQYACVKAHWCYAALAPQWCAAIDAAARRGAETDSDEDTTGASGTTIVTSS